ncbi:MAG: hypothetical protein U1F71_06480 [Verrucomicrobiaceae bacterium]
MNTLNRHFSPLVALLFPILTASCGVKFPAITQKQPAGSYATLKTAELFSIGGVGYAGKPSVEETAFRKLLKQQGQVTKFQKLLTEATPAGQIYALLGLKLLDSRAFDAALPYYKQSKTEIPRMSGCFMFKTTAADIVRQIQNGEVE